MTTNSKGLGRGLTALFNNPSGTPQEAASDSSNLKYIPLDQLVPNPNQPRKSFNQEALEDLTNSVRIQGILQPLLVQGPNNDGKYEIIAGERRFRAATKAGLAEVPVIIRNFPVSDTLVASLVENIQRENLNPIEEARAFLQIKENLGLTQQEVANALGLRRASLGNMLRLLNLSEAAQDDLIHGRISAAHGRSLASLPAEAAEKLRKRILATNMNVRGTEMAVSFWQENGKFPWKDADSKQYTRKPPELKALCRKLGDLYNCKANIQGSYDQGKIALTYKTNEELNELLAKLGLKDPVEIPENEPEQVVEEITEEVTEATPEAEN